MRSKFTIQNRYFRINHIEAIYGRYMGTLDKETRDSVNEFMYAFTTQLLNDCPYIGKLDSLSDVYLKKQQNE